MVLRFHLKTARKADYMYCVNYVNRANYTCFKNFDDAKSAWLFATRIGLSSINTIESATSDIINDTIITEYQIWNIVEDMCYFTEWEEVTIIGANGTTYERYRHSTKNRWK